MSKKRHDDGHRSMILLLLLGALLPTPLMGDTVLLVNGSRIDGLVLDQDQTRLVLQIGGLGTMQIPNSTVRSIEKIAGSVLLPAIPRVLIASSQFHRLRQLFPRRRRLGRHYCCPGRIPQ